MINLDELDADLISTDEIGDALRYLASNSLNPETREQALSLIKTRAA